MKSRYFYVCLGDHGDADEKFFPETTTDNDAAYMGPRANGVPNSGKFYPEPQSFKNVSERNLTHGFGLAQITSLRPEIYQFAMDKRRCSLYLNKAAVEYWVQKVRLQMHGYQSGFLLKIFKDKPQAWDFDDLIEGRDYPDFGQWATENNCEAPMKWPEQVETCHASLIENFTQTSTTATNVTKAAIDREAVNRLLATKQLQVLQELSTKFATTSPQLQQQTPDQQSFSQFAKIIKFSTDPRLGFSQEQKLKLSGLCAEKNETIRMFAMSVSETFNFDDAPAELVDNFKLLVCNYLDASKYHNKNATWARVFSFAVCFSF
jgi:hypothetical protein